MTLQAILEVIVLGIVQGIAEFLPVSSSGHLVIAHSLMTEFASGGQAASSEELSLSLNIALHLGTLFSIVIIFWRDIWKAAFSPAMIRSVFIATLPAVIVGFTLKDWLESLFSNPFFVGCFLLVTAGLLWLSSFYKEDSSSHIEEQTMQAPSWKVALLIGCFQAFAILPGISRSGSTIVAGLLLGLSREASARFSFLMAIPVIGGASLLLFKDLFDPDYAGAAIPQVGLLAVGVVVSFFVGLAALTWLLKWLKQGRLHWFAYYCGFVGIATISWQLLK